MSAAPLSLTLLLLLCAAILVDLLIGDPRPVPHPVVGIGRLIAVLERTWNAGSSRARHLKGFLLAGSVVGSTYLVTWGLIAGLAALHPWLGLAAEIWLLSTALAIKGLRDAALAVAMPLARGDLADARLALSMIVGRDTQDLDDAGVIRATVETVAENTVDGITAPMFWALVGGAPLALAYKAVNTLDSMVGYRNVRYADFGFASAKLDDLANWLPARLTVLTLWLGAPLVRATTGGWSEWRRTLDGTRRDAPCHPSPNAGWPEAMMAWLLGVQLGGVNRYAGRISRRAPMGVARAALRVSHIHAAIAHMHAGWGVFACLLAGLVVGRHLA